MNGGLKRGAGVAGIVFVVLFVLGALFSTDTPDGSDLTSSVADQKLLSYLSSSDNRVQHIIAAYLLILAGIAFVWFCQGLRTRLDAAAPGDPTGGRFITSMSAVGATLLAFAGMASADIAGAVSLGGEPLPSEGSSARVMMNLTVPTLLVAFALVAAAVIATVSVLSLGSGALPRWLAYTAWLGVLGCIGGVIFLPMVLALLWFLAVAIVLLTRPSGTAISQSAT